MSPSVSVALQHLYPRRLLSRIVLHATRIRIAPWQRWLIRTVVRRYDVDLSDAVEPDPGHWPTFNAFFTRALRPEARPLPAPPDAVASPADGIVQDVGELSGSQLVQAKSLTYSIASLLGGDEEAATALAGGAAATIYLAPRDYHRVHLPVDGALAALVHLPGDRFSVNPATSERIPHLFPRNERVVFHFRDPRGRPFAIVMVGALLVGCIETPWTGVVADLPSPGRSPALGPRTTPPSREAPRLAASTWARRSSPSFLPAPSAGTPPSARAPPSAAGRPSAASSPEDDTPPAVRLPPTARKRRQDPHPPKSPRNPWTGRHPAFRSRLHCLHMLQAIVIVLR